MIDREAARESFADSVLATLINFPLNYILIWIAFRFEMTVMQTTLFCTSILFIVATYRKYRVRIHFKGKLNAES